MSTPLRGCRVLVTRPAHQADALCRMIEAAGGEAARLPLLAIEPLRDDAALKADLEAWRDADGWIFTSRNAVDCAVQLDPGPWPTLFAVGTATAQALADAGRGDALVPRDTFSSEGLLALPQLAAVDGRRFAVLGGEGGRDVLARTLSERGAQVTHLALYRRTPVSYDETRVEAEVGMADAIVVTSLEGLQRLRSVTPEAMRALLLGRTLVVPSARVADQAREMGFAQVLVPDDATDEALLRCLEAWRAAAAPASAPAGTSRRRGAAPREAEAVPAAAGAGATASPRSAPTPDATTGSRAEPSRASGALPWVLVVLLAAALLAGGAWLWLRQGDERAARSAQALAVADLNRQVSELQARVAQHGSRLGDVAQTTQRNALDVATLSQRFDESAQLMGRVSEELQGGRTRAQLVSIEQLLMAANDRLQLEGDVAAARTALDIADRRLARLREPRLFIVREAIAEERTALNAVPERDLTQPVLQLTSLIESVQRLPLRVDPDAATAEDGPPASSAAPEGPVAQGWARTRAALDEVVDSLFQVRRIDDPMTLQLLPLEQQETIRQVLTLRLEAARIALLRRDDALLGAAADAAADWLREHFDADDAAVAAALDDLAGLQSLPLDAELPDIGRSLRLLRAQLEADPQ